MPKNHVTDVMGFGPYRDNASTMAGWRAEEETGNHRHVHHHSHHAVTACGGRDVGLDTWHPHDRKAECSGSDTAYRAG